MYTYHAWIELWAESGENEHQVLDEKVETLKEVVQDKLRMGQQVPIVYLNYITTLQCFSSHNHLTDAHERLIYVLDWICRELPGSFGLVYWTDDEAEDWKKFPGYNVIVMKKGKLYHETDRFLSPITEIEDYYEG